MEKSYNRKNALFKLPINVDHYLLAKKTRSKRNKFHYDTISVYLMTGSKKIGYVLEDSFEFSAYPELVNAIDEIIQKPIHCEIVSIGAPVNRGGMYLVIKKLCCETVKLQFTREKNGCLKVVCSYVIPFSVLYEWKRIMNEFRDNTEKIFDVN